jgi:hypothetical protein
MPDTPKNVQSEPNLKGSDMTDEEYDTLEEEVTRNPPNVAGKPGGFFTERRDRMILLDQFSADYLKAAAEAEHKTPAQIVGELVRKELASAS